MVSVHESHLSFISTVVDHIVRFFFLLQSICPKEVDPLYNIRHLLVLLLTAGRCGAHPSFRGVLGICLLLIIMRNNHRRKRKVKIFKTDKGIKWWVIAISDVQVAARVPK